MWTDFNTVPCTEEAVGHNSVNLRSKIPLQKKHLVTLCSEHFKHSLCSRWAAILHGRGKLHNTVSGQAWPSQSLGYRGLLLSEVVLPNHVGGRPSRQIWGLRPMESFPHWPLPIFSGSSVSFWLLLSALWISHQPTSLILLPTLFLFLALPSTTCNVRNPFLGLTNRQPISAAYYPQINVDN